MELGFKSNFLGFLDSHYTLYEVLGAKDVSQALPLRTLSLGRYGRLEWRCITYEERLVRNLTDSFTNR